MADAPYRDPICDPKTGVVSQNWLKYFNDLNTGGALSGFTNVTINRSFTGSQGASLDITIDASRLTGTELASNVVRSSLKTVGVLTGGSTGLGFIVDLGLSTLLGTIPWTALPTGTGTWVAQPTIIGQVTVNGGISVLNDITPLHGYQSNLGLPTSKFLSLWCAELFVETLVAQQVMATIGGRIVVAPTTTLTADLAPSDTAVTVKYNNLTNGDILRMEARGQIEFLKVTSVVGGTGGAWTYSVTRNYGGATSAQQWYIGDALLDTGTTGNGYIDLYSIGGIFGGFGPTIVGNVRTGTTYNAVDPRWAIGNLNGLYGYAVDTYGAAFGDNAKAWVKIDPTNGVRIGFNATVNAQVDATGAASFTGSITVTGGNAAKKDFSNVTANYAGSTSIAGNALDTDKVNAVAASTVQGGAARANLGLNSSGVVVTKVIPGSTVAPSGAGLYLGSDFLGYYNGSAWRTYMDSSGQFFLGSATSTTNSLTWDGSTLNVGADGINSGRNGAANGVFGLWSLSTVVLGPSPTPGCTFGIDGSNRLFFFNGYGTIIFHQDTTLAGTLTVTGVTSLAGILTDVTQKSAKYLYPGSASGLSDYQTSYYLASDASWGLYTNTNIGAAGSFYAGVGQSAGTAGYGFFFAGDTDTGVDNDASNRIRFHAGGIHIFWDGTQFFPENDGVKNLGAGSFRWNTVYATNGTINTSDARLKIGILDADLGTDFLLRLRPVSFYWRNNDPVKRYGFLAHDVAALFASAEDFGGVYIGEDGIAAGLNYSTFIAPIVKGFQELDVRVRALEAQRCSC